MPGALQRGAPSFEGPWERDVSPWLAPLLAAGESLFGLGVRARRAAYDAGLFPTVRPTRSVISVGNLAVGGTGKTPFVILLARLLEARGVRAAVLSRGYGRRRGGSDPLTVSVGLGPLRDAREAGDEPVLIAEHTRSAVVVSKRRIDAAKVATDALAAELLILDDGFQHFGLARDLDIVVLDGSRPFGNGRLLPRGPLRERPGALQRADLVVLNYGHAPARWEDGAQSGRNREGFPCELAPFLAGTPVVVVGVFATSVGLPRSADRAPAASLRGRRVALLAAIARPQRFEETVAGLGASVVSRSFFRDHADLGVSELAQFRRAARDTGAELLLTTEKDAVRMDPLLSGDIETLAIEHRVISGAEELDRALSPLLGRANLKRSEILGA